MLSPQKKELTPSKSQAFSCRYFLCERPVDFRAYVFRMDSYVAGMDYQLFSGFRRRTCPGRDEEECPRRSSIPLVIFQAGVELDLFTDIHRACM